YSLSFSFSFSRFPSFNLISSWSHLSLPSQSSFLIHQLPAHPPTPHSASPDPSLLLPCCWERGVGAGGAPIWADGREGASTATARDSFSPHGARAAPPCVPPPGTARWTGTWTGLRIGELAEQLARPSSRSLRSRAHGSLTRTASTEDRQGSM